jgi:dienelactone hydrolase
MKRMLFELLALSLFLGAVGQIRSDPVHALCDLTRPTNGPFPSNWFTVPDETQNTGRRVNLPLPDPATQRSDYEDSQVLNTLDGFNLQPRLSIPFDGPIDVSTVSSKTVFLVSLGDTLPGGNKGGEVVGINQVVWDVATTTLHVKSDALLAQHTRYALLVMNGIHDSNGDPVEATEVFRQLQQTSARLEYKDELLDAMHAAADLGVPEQDIVTASVFTTLSATAMLEKIRDQIKAGTPAPADFLLGADGTRTVFPLDKLTGITWNAQDGVNPTRFGSLALDPSLFRVIRGAIGQLAYGKYVSPDYELHPGEYIPPVGTYTGTPVVQGTNEIYFNLALPSGPKPAGGWPVAIFGHGLTSFKEDYAYVAATMAAHGIATIAINVVGHGYGPLSTLTVNRRSTDGGPVTFPSGGRGIDQNNDHAIDNFEGLNAALPATILSNRDGLRQTVADLMQLVRVIEVGMDVDGDGSPDLDPSRIYYFGHSLGGIYGTVFLGVEPSVRAGVPIVGGGPVVDIFRLSPPYFRSNFIGSGLQLRKPSLLNRPGIGQIDGVSVVAGPFFNENMPPRDGIPLPVRLTNGMSRNIQSPVINDVAGAMAIQEVIENTEWVSQSGSPVTYAPHLRKDSLPGMPAKSIIFQFAKGDPVVPNPTTTAILRAGDLADRATLYRHDLAFADNRNLGNNPHGFTLSVDDSNFKAIALGAQEQIASFFASDGVDVIHPEPAKYFEVPIQGPLPEDLNYIP